MLKSIRIKNFRNIENQLLEFSKNNLIYGNNGEGKTSLLESIYYLIFFKSYITGKDNEIKKIDKEYLFLNGKYDNNDVVDILYNKNGKYIKYNDKKIKNISSKFGYYNAIVYSNNDIYIINESNIRKRFFNFYISQYDKNYLLYLSEYMKLLNQKRELLKLRKIKLIKFYNEKLSILSAHMGKIKNDFFNDVKKIFNEIKNSNNYSIDFKFEDNENVWLNRFEKILNSEIDNKIIYEGSHREDIKFRNLNRDIKKISSEGQKKIFMIFIKTAIYYLLKNRAKKSIILVDDLLSKLDNNNYNILIDILKKSDDQIFFTSINRVEKIDIDLNNIFNVENGIFTKIGV